MNKNPLNDIDLENGNWAEPNLRPYVHKKCGGATVVTGGDFELVVNPFNLMSQTYCASCQKMVDLDAVAWVDPGEKLSAYRRRLRAETPMLLNLLGWVVLPFGGAALGAWIAAQIAPNKLTYAIFGGILGLFLGAVILTPALVKWVWRIDNRSVK